MGLKYKLDHLFFHSSYRDTFMSLKAYESRQVSYIDGNIVYVGQFSFHKTIILLLLSFKKGRAQNGALQDPKSHFLCFIGIIGNYDF